MDRVILRLSVFIACLALGAEAVMVNRRTGAASKSKSVRKSAGLAGMLLLPAAVTGAASVAPVKPAMPYTSGPTLSMSASMPSLPSLCGYGLLKCDQQPHHQRTRKIMLSSADDETTRDTNDLFGPSRISMSMAALEKPITQPLDRVCYDDGLGPQHDSVSIGDNESTSVGTGWKDIESATASLRKLAGLSHDTPEYKALRDRAHHWDAYKREQAASESDATTKSIRNTEKEIGMTPQQQVRVLQKIMDESAQVVHK